MENFMSNNIIYHAFRKKFESISNKLTSSAEIKTGDLKLAAIALWDTGATITCISDNVVSKLGLKSTGKQFILTPSGSKVVDTYLIDIILPNDVEVLDVQVCGSDIGNQGLDLLIGMDIITKGDFAVSNYEGKTCFTFRTPSKHQTDYVRDIKLENLIGPKHGKGKRNK